MILGGGLAGLSTALSLAECGMQVEVFERKSVPGGRATSYVAQDSEEEVDNCQHVLMRCCTNLWDFYGRSGVQDKIRWFDSLSFLEPSGEISVLRGSRLPAPFHLLPSFFRARFLGNSDKLAVARALMRLLPAGSRKAAGGKTALQWLEDERQTPRAIDRFWRMVLVSALNEDIERCSAVQAQQIFRLGFLAHSQAYQMGVPAVPLRELYEPCVDRIRQRGGVVHYRGIVRGIEIDDTGRALGVRLDGGTLLPADYVVSAVAHDAVPALIPGRWGDDPHFRACRTMESSPISAVHLWFDREITRMDHAVLLDREVHWMFNKTRNYARQPGEGSYLGLVVSASRDWLGLPRREILEIAEKDVRQSFPGARDAIVVRSAVIKEAKATFSITPQAEADRPSIETPVRGLYLTGDWVQTGWPATMEGAVRSGYGAAERILAAEGRPARIVQPDLPWASLLGSA